MLAAAILTQRTAKYMNLQLSRDGSLTAGEIDVSVLYGAAAREDSGLYGSQSTSLLTRRGGRLPSDGGSRGRFEVPQGDGLTSDADLYLRPHRAKSVCAKVMEYFFSY